jgi:PncC family amidohydrolase
VTYNNEVKHSLLGVRRDTLERNGAVSEEVARQMAIGGRQAFDTDYAISITGIAGPGGGTPDKPVGLTYVAVAAPDRVEVRRFVWQGSRQGNKISSADAALGLLLEILNEKESSEITKEETMPESAAVEATFAPDGAIKPGAFVWNGQRRQITDQGRRWKDDATGMRHFLVMTGDSRIWELRFDPTSLRWSIEPKTQARYVV